MMPAGNEHRFAARSSLRGVQVVAPQLEKHVKNALENVHDLVYLREHPLMRLLVPTTWFDSMRGARLLQRYLFTAIEQLKPEAEVARREPAWRTYRLLSLRYVDDVTFHEAMDRLGLSQTQYHRDQRHAIQAVAAVLWDTHVGNTPHAPPPVPAVITRDNLEATCSPTLSRPDSTRLPVDEQEYVWVAGLCDDPFYDDGRRGWAAAAAALHVRAHVAGPRDTDAESQRWLLESIVAGPNTAGIFIYPLDHCMVSDALRKARRRGIAVVLGNSDADDAEVRNAFIGPVNEALGQRAADLAAELLGGEGDAGIVGYMNRPCQIRYRAFEARLGAAYPKMRIRGVVTAHDSLEDAGRATEALLAEHPEVNLIYVPDACAGRVAKVLRDQGLAGKIQVIGSDKSPDLLSAIRDGSVAATVVQDTYSEEFIALHYLYWAYNGISSVPNTSFVSMWNPSQRAMALV